MRLGELDLPMLGPHADCCIGILSESFKSCIFIEQYCSRSQDASKIERANTREWPSNPLRLNDDNPAVLENLIPFMIMVAVVCCDQERATFENIQARHMFMFSPSVPRWTGIQEGVHTKENICSATARLHHRKDDRHDRRERASGAA